MAIPLLEYAPSSQNQRVVSYEIPGDEQPRIFSTERLLSATEMTDLISAAYRQIFNEQQMLSSTRQKFLESQLRCGQITVRDFIRGLALSDSFRARNYEVSNNYRFAQMCVQRILGRDVYDEREKLAWSIVLATKGLQGFVDTLLNSEEYLDNFGYDTVPYQRRRILPQRSQGELPFARMPRYGADHLAQLKALGHNFDATGGMVVDLKWRPPASAAQFGTFLAYAGGAGVALLAATVILSWFGFIAL